MLATRATGEQRINNEDPGDRVRLVQLLFGAGLNSRSVFHLLSCIYSDTLAPAMFDRLPAEQARVDELAAAMIETRERLDRVMDEARHRRFPAALGRHPCVTARCGRHRSQRAGAVESGAASTHGVDRRENVPSPPSFADLDQFLFVDHAAQDGPRPCPVYGK